MGQASKPALDSTWRFPVDDVGWCWRIVLAWRTKASRPNQVSTRRQPRTVSVQEIARFRQMLLPIQSSRLASQPLTQHATSQSPKLSSVHLVFSMQAAFYVCYVTTPYPI
ncbi:hypothetical protein J3458_000973 [Metarhizium acridum]|uniref:uncharacterized protein n=1 Tax=Metarhizium acridum TaxID=92637 RepID=UPI001C6AFE15|nr:hypothetical protein J3458_000973 [Metarhizium acridum]